MAKILIAEDDKFLSTAFQVKLTKLGHDVKIAGDGNQVLEILKTFTPDIILLDLIMPVKDGFGVLEDLKASKTLETIPVIIASNLGEKEEIDKGLALGAKDYIIKSNLSFDELDKKIKGYIAQA
ncbi:MAG: response regulator [Candidatus Levybacteria bacterium]|nr:response regulator [Candidatus Levybacteria bacterium]